MSITAAECFAIHYSGLQPTSLYSKIKSLGTMATEGPTAFVICDCAGMTKAEINPGAIVDNVGSRPFPLTPVPVSHGNHQHVKVGVGHCPACKTIYTCVLDRSDCDEL